MNEILLAGCRPEPLLSYLKSLGLFRLVSEQFDGQARAAWRNGAFLLRCSEPVDALVGFFLEQYRPTPIVAPWAGGSGFFEGDNTEAVQEIASSTNDRLEPYREIVAQVRRVLQEEGLTEKPPKDAKARLLRRYRRELPDGFVEWMDCVLVLQRDEQVFPPILGTGGNDGRLDFTQNFMQRIVEMGIHQGACRPDAASWLQNALFGKLIKNLSARAVGQFDPGRVGGPNATTGLEGGSLVNPWDFVFMIEGALLFSGSPSRRLGLSSVEGASFPFTVTRASPGGQGGLSASESARGEIWLPLWSDLVSLIELKHLFSEGRGEISGRPSRDGVDFARAVAGLGVDRGFTSFNRYGFLKRSGKAYLATSMGRFDVHRRPGLDLLLEVDPWVQRFRRAHAGKGVPPRFRAALNMYDAAVLDLCRYGGLSHFGDVLVSLGRMERETALRPGKEKVDPTPYLSPSWIEACDDGSPEYRIAVAVASIAGSPHVPPIRSNVEPVVCRPRRCVWSAGSGATAAAGASLCRFMNKLLSLRILAANQLGLDTVPLEARRAASIEDVSLFLHGVVDDRRILGLIWGAALIHPWESWPRPVHPFPDAPPLPRAYALLKLLFLPAAEALRADSGRPIGIEPAVIGKLRAGDIQKSMEISGRKLRGAGFQPIPGKTSAGRMRRMDPPGPIRPERLQAALLIPVDDSYKLKALVLRKKIETSRVTP